MSGAALRRARISLRKPGSPAKNETASRRISISSGAVKGAARRSARRRLPGAVTVLSIAASREPSRAPDKRSRQFEIGSCRGIDVHPRVAREPGWQAQGGPRGKLGALDIKDRDGGGGDLGAGKRAQSVERREPEIILDAALGACPFARLAAERRHGQLCLAREPRQARQGEQRFGSDDFGRIDARDLGLEGRLGGAGDDEGSGRNIDGREPEKRLRRAAARDGEQAVGADGIEQQFLGDGARRHQAHHLPADDGFRPAFARLGRVLDLLADGDAVALADQPVQIVLGALDRHAAHGNVLSLVLAALGQDNAERPGGDLGVVEEQFVEIAHPVEQEGAGILRLDRAVLRHHRRDFGAIRAAPRSFAGGLRKSTFKRGWMAGAAFEHGPS